MANQNAPFGLRPIGKVGQNDDNQGLSEFSIAASSTAMYQNDPVAAASDGNIIVVSTSTATILGSLNGIYYTDANTSKPTWANNLKAANTATDIVGFVDSVCTYKILSWKIYSLIYLFVSCHPIKIT